MCGKELCRTTAVMIYYIIRSENGISLTSPWLTEERSNCGQDRKNTLATNNVHNFFQMSKFPKIGTRNK